MHWSKDLTNSCTGQSGIPPSVSLEQMSVLFTSLAMLLAVCLGMFLFEIMTSCIMKHYFIVPMAAYIWTLTVTPASVPRDNLAVLSTPSEENNY